MKSVKSTLSLQRYMQTEQHEAVTIIEGFQVAAVDGEGLCIVDEDCHYWRVVGHSVAQKRDDLLAQAYREAINK